ncbi:uncharacterized protein [Diadema setosum]|uniref:uncharacterized protein n=1 Tax=Diadema setosum TaxID=31175 RepID=UPI003B3AFEDB
MTRQTAALLKEILQDNEFLNAIRRTVEDAVATKVSEYLMRVEQTEGKVLELQCKLDNCEKELCEVKKENEKSFHEINKLKTKLNDQEQYSRRNCVRFFGVPETEKEDTTETIRRISKEMLDVDLPSSAIDRSHRVRRRNPPPEGTRPKPRAIIVKLTSYQYRQTLLKNKKKLKEKKSGISIHEDLTDSNRALLWDAFTMIRKPNSKLTHAWSMDGRIFVSVNTHNGTPLKKIVHSRRDLDHL